MKKFKVLTILLFALIVVNAIIDKSAILLPPNANFIEYFAKRVPVYCRIEPKDDIKDLPLINVGDVQIENLSSQADLSVITEYSGVSMLWLKKTAQNRHEANEMFLATILFVVVSASIRSTRSPLPSDESSASTFCVPAPRKERWGAPQEGHSVGIGRFAPQAWQRRYPPAYAV